MNKTFASVAASVVALGALALAHPAQAAGTSLNMFSASSGTLSFETSNDTLFADLADTSGDMLDLMGTGTPSTFGNEILITGTLTGTYFETGVAPDPISSTAYVLAGSTGGSNILTFDGDTFDIKTVGSVLNGKSGNVAPTPEASSIVSMGVITLLGAGALLAGRRKRTGSAAA